MEYKFKNIEEQKIILENRGIEIDDISLLGKVNYSHLIYKYGSLFKNKENEDKYIENTKISHIYNLFLLNNKISTIILDFFLEFEHKLKFSVAHHLSSIDPLFHLKINNFDLIHSGQSEACNFISNIIKLDYKTKLKIGVERLIDDHVPIWLLIDEMALGQIRMLIKLSGENNQGIILENIGLNWYDWSKIILFNAYRNRILHANPITGELIINGLTYRLKDLIQMIKSLYPKIFDNIKNIIDNYDFAKQINLSKDYILDYLNIKKFFI